MMNTLLAIVLMIPTGPACCDDANDVGSCSPFDYLAEVGGVCDRPTIDAEVAWCDQMHNQCWDANDHTGLWRCCSFGGCEMPLGDVLVFGDELILCEADATPLWCEFWGDLDSGKWECETV